MDKSIVSMKNRLHINCRSATFLISKKDERAITFFENLQLQLHLKVCSLCRLFKIQSSFILRNIKQQPSNTNLSKATKEKMINEVNKIIQKA